MIIEIAIADHRQFRWAQATVAARHYLRSAVDPRSRPFAYVARLGTELIGCLIFGRPESTRCYQGGLTYGDGRDVASGRAMFDRWEILNLARVWLDPRVQAGGEWCQPDLVPGFHDRQGIWRPAVASTLIRMSLQTIGRDYLLRHPPVWVDQPYQIRAVLSYCDTRLHRGTIYRAAGFRLARCNDDGIETWWTADVVSPAPGDDDEIRQASRRSRRAAVIRGRRQAESQPTLFAENER